MDRRPLADRQVSVANQPHNSAWPSLCG